MKRFFQLLRRPKTDKIYSGSESPVIREIAALLKKRSMSPLARSISVRMIDCGSSNDVEVEEVMTTSPQVDCDRFGIHYVASPRHADVLLASGPVTINMKLALERTYDAMPGPKVVVAAGDGAVSGGLFGKSKFVFKSGKVSDVVPVAVNVPGNPPTPYELVLGVLKAGEALSKKR